LIRTFGTRIGSVDRWASEWDLPAGPCGCYGGTVPDPGIPTV